ncbi:unnamed protein product [Zymoseptoria tritici ST99CH_1A5]|uniref:Uncharacterized protein n=2 Tax=Zymoseptoria tritici TaxID=1047171 RepID=A0A1X7S5T0_ZYMT9|nr:unnamed protein product [Zymoseptoria tritici ST99CH_3D7]SMY28708.1 unnamed protein product [Zymoseptoria tritici ST99CH_1A5]
MSPLRLPANAASILERAWHGEANTSEFDKWLVYTTENVPSSAAAEVAHAAMSAYNDQALHEPESEWDEIGFIKPPTQDHEHLQSPTLQAVLEHHLDMVSRQSRNSASNGEDDQNFYIWGFIAVTTPEWRSQGITAVHCDKDRGKWKVTQCRKFPIDKLGWELTSVSDHDDQFDNIRVRYDDADNDGEDNRGGPAPQGEWQFIVFYSGCSRSEAEKRIPDPRSGPDWPMGEGVFTVRPTEMTVETMTEEFPITYAELIRDAVVPGSGSRRICVIHPALFVAVEGGEGGNVKISRLRWDHNIERTEDELRKVGKEGQFDVQSCDAASVVSRLKELAAET